MEAVTIGLLVAVIMGICQAVKVSKLLKGRYIPLFALVLGILGVYLLEGVNSLATLAGVLAGLSSAGLYDLVAYTALNKTSKTA